jgi:hypothetical protein
MFEALLAVKNPDKDGWEGEGKKSFRVLPQVGEFIELATDHIAYLYKVVAIIHPGEPGGPGDYPVDIYAVKLGRRDDVLNDL